MKSGETELNTLNRTENLSNHKEKNIDELLNLSVQKQAINDHTPAIEYAQQAEIKSKRSHRFDDFLQSILLQVRSLYNMNKYQRGLEKISEGEKILNTLESTETMRERRAEFFMLKGDIYAGLGELEKAISSYKQVKNLYRSNS